MVLITLPRNLGTFGHIQSAEEERCITSDKALGQRMSGWMGDSTASLSFLPFSNIPLSE